MQHYLRRLSGEILADGINDIDKPGVCKILNIVHDSGTARFYVYRMLTDVWCFRTVNSQLVKQLLYFCKVFQFYLLDEKDIHLRHHVHGLQQILREIALLKKERIEAMMNVRLEILNRTDMRQNFLDDVLMVTEDFIKCVRPEVVASLQIQKLSERKTS